MTFRPAILPLILLGLLCRGGLAAGTEEMIYDITWIGISVGSMTVTQDEEKDTGAILRTIRIRNRPWISAIYSVDNTIRCRMEETPEGPKYTVSKQMAEENFAQNDILTLWPDKELATWSNAVEQTVQTFPIPKTARDFVSFFFDLRDTVGDNALQANGTYQLVQDAGVHALELSTGEPRRIRTPFGRMEAIQVKAVSKSKQLFSRNRPKAVWVSASKPVVLFADVETRFATVRGTLVTWTVNGKSVPIVPVAASD